MPEKDSQRAHDNESRRPETRVPQGFTEHSSGLASEYARELGWGTNEEERTRTPSHKQEYDGGRNYDYGAQDFGDAAVDTSSAQAPPSRNKAHQGGRSAS